MATSRASRRELLLAALLLAAVAALIYGPHTWEGGFAIDDWGNALAAKYPRTGSVVQDFWEQQHVRPGLALYIPATHWLLGANAHLHILLAVILAVAMSLALWALLRRLRFTSLDAGAIALLVLMFPWASGVRFWAVAGHISFAIAIAILGVIATLRALDERSSGHSRRSVALRLGGLVLYSVSVLTYDIAVLPLLLVGGLYLSRANWHVVWRWWAVDAAVVIASAAVLQFKLERERYPFDEMFDHARVMLDGGATVLAQAAFPFGYPFESSTRSLILAGLGVVIVLVVVVRNLRAWSDVRGLLDRWALVGGAGLLLAVASWAQFIPAHSYYHPAQLGVGNRVNALAAIGIVLVVYAAVIAVGLVLSKGSPRLASVIAGVLTAVLLLSYAYDTKDEQKAWARAATSADHVLAVIEQEVPEPRPGNTIYTFGHAGGERPGIPVFGYSWDLDGAVGLLYDTPYLNAYPVLQGTVIDCLAGGIAPSGAGLGPEANGARYGMGYFVDVASQSAVLIGSRQDCLVARRKFVAGPAVR